MALKDDRAEREGQVTDLLRRHRRISLAWAADDGRFQHALAALCPGCCPTASGQEETWPPACRARVICRDWGSEAASARGAFRVSCPQGSWAQGRGVFSDKGRVNSWAAPGTGNGKGAPAGPGARRLGRGWHAAFSSTGSCAVVASAMRGISHTGIETSSNVMPWAGDVNRFAGCAPGEVGFMSHWRQGNFGVASSRWPIPR
jgi:hypothetical protein